MATLLYNNRPARPSFHSALNEMLRDTLPAQGQPTESFSPAADVLEGPEGFQVLLMLPGVAKEEVKIDFQEGQLTVSGERKAPETAENSPQFRRVESGYGRFSRTFRLPDTVDVMAISAELTSGILHLMLPFDSKKVSKRQIEVR